MDFVLSNTIKIDILNKARPLIENALYEILVMQGLDPDTFDPDTFVPVEGNLDHETMAKLLQKHSNLISKIKELGG